MRKHLTLLLVLLYALLFKATGQWQWLNPQPSGNALIKVVFTDMNNGFLLNNNGDLITTTDQGEHWTIQQNFNAGLSMDMKDGTGVIGSYNGVLYVSQDRGASWFRKNIGSTDQFSMVDVVSKDTIFMATPSGKVCRSDDGGNVWKSFNTGIRISSIDFINSKTGYVGGSSTDILKTEDGGATWQKNVSVNTSPSNTLSIKFLNLMTGYAFREHSTLLKTIDGGKNWTKSDIIDDIFSICPVSDSIVFLAGEYGVVYRTDNGGRTWIPKGFGARYAGYDYRSAWFFNGTTGIAVGSRGRIMKTKDGGDTWSAYSPIYIDVRDIGVPATKTAYAVAGAEVYKSIDRGQNWKALNFPAVIGKTDAQLNFTHFISADTGFVASNEETPNIYKTYDGGKTWKKISVLNFVNITIEGMHFINNYTGYLTIQNVIFGTSLIMKTTDGGESWSQVWRATYFGDRFNKIYFVNEATGYAIRYDRLFRSIDGGASWTEQFTGGSPFSVTCVEFINATTGFLAESSGGLRKTTDDGKTWTKINVPSQGNEVITGIKFISQKVGYLTGDAGGIYKTVDGGTTWSGYGRIASNIRAIKMAPDSTVYLAGSNGSILRQADPSYSFFTFSSGITNTCNIDFYSIINASPLADSAFFEYGVNDFDKSVPAKLTNLNTSQQGMAATIAQLPPSTVLKVRLKVFFRGEWYYTTNQMIYMSGDRPPAPSIVANGPTTVCIGQQVILSSSSAFSNQWLLNGMAIPGANNASYTTRTPGKYQLITLSLCYNSDTASILIVNKPQPKKPVISVSGAMLHSSSNTGNQWFVQGVPIAGETNNNYTAHINGKYNVQVTQDGCSSELSDTLDYTTPGRTLITYPNPVKNLLTVSNSMGEKMGIILTDASGNVIVKEESNGPTYVMDFRHLTRGNYFLKVTLLESKKVFARTVFKQ